MVLSEVEHVKSRKGEKRFHMLSAGHQYRVSETVRVSERVEKIETIDATASAR